MTTFAQTDIADVDNVNLDAILPLITPAILKTQLPLSEKAIFSGSRYGFSGRHGKLQ